MNVTDYIRGVWFREGVRYTENAISEKYLYRDRGETYVTYAYVFEIIGEFGRAIPRMVVGGGRQDGFENFLIGSVPTGKLIYTDEFDRTTSFNIIIIVRFGAVNELYV